MEVKLPPKTQSVRGGIASGQSHGNKTYSFKDEHMVSLFKLLQKSNRFKLLEIRHPEELGMTDICCLYHRMLRHPTKNFYIFKDVLHALIDAKVLKLRPE